MQQTQSIKYAGSKLKLLKDINNILSHYKFNTVLDGFSGSTRVSQMFSNMGYTTHSNDISEWSYVLANCFLLNTKSKKYYEEIIMYLNNLNGYEGWFSENYGGTDLTFKKYPFQLKNTKKLDAIRDEIETLNLSEIEKSVILTSLILALDKVDNTMGHHTSYLKKWASRSFLDLKLEVPNLHIPNQKNFVYKDDIFNTIQGKEFDLTYYDPPYGSNNEKMPSSRVRYNSYYHIWTTIIKNDKPDLFGKANRRIDSRDDMNSSIFESYKKNDENKFEALDAIKKLIENTHSKYILLSYSSGGRATENELFNILNSNGTIEKTLKIDYKKNVMANMKWTNEWSSSEKNYEFLFLLKK
jgi:adenine-specific DNA-methyltransferase